MGWKHIFREAPMRQWSRLVLQVFNRLFMIPAFRLGLGAFVGNPLTGYIMLLRTVGRRTARVRYTPVNYALLEGSVYCVAGWRERSHWYRNLRAYPAVEAVLPSGPVAGLASTVTDPSERLRAIRQILRNAGFAGFFLGVNPARAPDEVLLKRSAGFPVVRIRPTGPGSGAADPGGWLWILMLLLILWLVTR